MTTCIAPSVVLNTSTASEFGTVAEKIIAACYLRDARRGGFFPLPPGVDFLDIADGFGNTVLYLAFLKLHHPSLSPSQLLALSGEGQVKIPDIASQLAPARSEFYEIKPNSGPGLAAGRIKVASIDALYTAFGLPYVPGVAWNVDRRQLIFEGNLLGIGVKVSFHYFLKQPGLVVYEICAEGKARPLTNAEVAAIIALVLLAALAAALSDGLALIPLLA